MKKKNEKSVKKKKKKRKRRNDTCNISLFRSYNIISARSCVFFSLKCQIPCQIWYNVIVRNVFIYQRMNAYKNMFVYILLHTFLKWSVFPSPTKLCKSNWRAKSVSTSNMPQSSSCSSNYMLLPVIVWPWTVERFL